MLRIGKPLSPEEREQRDVEIRGQQEAEAAEKRKLKEAARRKKEIERQRRRESISLTKRKHRYYVVSLVLFFFLITSSVWFQWVFQGALPTDKARLQLTLLAFGLSFLEVLILVAFYAIPYKKRRSTALKNYLSGIYIHALNHSVMNPQYKPKEPHDQPNSTTSTN